MDNAPIEMWGVCPQLLNLGGFCDYLNLYHMVEVMECHSPGPGINRLAISTSCLLKLSRLTALGCWTGPERLHGEGERPNWDQPSSHFCQGARRKSNALLDPLDHLSLPAEYRWVTLVGCSAEQKNYSAEPWAGPHNCSWVQIPDLHDCKMWYYCCHLKPLSFRVIC